MDTLSDFVVESKGHCFLCLDEIPFQQVSEEDVKPDIGLLDSATPSTSSLQILSRYLGLELRKVFNHESEDTIPPHLLETIKRSKLNGELCEECAVLNANFGSLYQKLETIQMEVLASLSQIHAKLLKGKGTNKLDELKGLSESMATSLTSAVGWSGQLDILEGVRAEAIEKSSQILSGAPPRVMVQPLPKWDNMEKVTEKLSADTRHLQSSSPNSFEESLEPGTAITVKIEYGSANTIPSDEDNSYRPSGDFPASYLDMTPTSNQNEGNPSTSKKVNRGKKKMSPACIPNVEIPKSVLNQESGKYKCGLCPSEFKTVQIYKDHYKIFHLNLRYKCTVCGIEFKGSGAYYSHRLVAHKGFNLTCSVCGKCFCRKSLLERHQKVTSCKDGKAPKPKKHVCRCHYCRKGFVSEKLLKRHLKEVHSHARKFVCDVCGMKFKRKAHIEGHRKIHEG